MLVPKWISRDRGDALAEGEPVSEARAPDAGESGVLEARGQFERIAPAAGHGSEADGRHGSGHGCSPPLESGEV